MKIKTIVTIIFLIVINITSISVIAQNNQENANLILGKKYFHGFEVSKDYKKAYELFKVAGKNGEPLGYLYMGYMHSVGLDVEHTHEKSNYYYELAAKQGLVEGEYQLALNKKTELILLSLSGGDEYSKINEEMIKLLLDAADKGHLYAQIEVVNLYFYHDIKDKNPVEKIVFYLKSAIAQSKKVGYAMAGAIASDDGNSEEMKYYLDIAASERSVIAAAILSKNYICGTNVEKDNKIALKYKELAIKNGADGRDLEEINEMLKDGCKRPYEDKLFGYSAKDAVVDYYSRHRLDFGIIYDSLINYKFKN